MIGDYFDLYKEGVPTTRVIQTHDEWVNGDIKRFCLAMDIDRRLIGVDLDKEVEFVIGNIFK